MEEISDSFQLYRDWEIPRETTVTGKELPTIHTYRVIVSPAGQEPTRQRCVASCETNLATDWAIPAKSNSSKLRCPAAALIFYVMTHMRWLSVATYSDLLCSSLYYVYYISSCTNRFCKRTKKFQIRLRPNTRSYHFLLIPWYVRRFGMSSFVKGWSISVLRLFLNIVVCERVISKYFDKALRLFFDIIVCQGVINNCFDKVLRVFLNIVVCKGVIHTISILTRLCVCFWISSFFKGWSISVLTRSCVCFWISSFVKGWSVTVWTRSSLCFWISQFVKGWFCFLFWQCHVFVCFKITSFVKGWYISVFTRSCVWFWIPSFVKRWFISVLTRSCVCF